MKKILVVDDSKANIEALKFLLKSKYEVLTAMSGEETFELLKKEKIDLILLDIILPDMDGYEICKKLKENERTKNIPVIFVTARIDDESISKAYEVGGVDYITKPLKAVEVICRIETQLKIQNLIKELQTTKSELEQLASRDFLTGIYNRRSFETFAKSLINSNEVISLILIDIDHFKNINDTYGHLIGDEVLKYVTNKLKSLVRNDDLFARIGGEEFVVLLPNTTLEEAKQIAEKLRKTIESQPIKLQDGIVINITISLGVTTLNNTETLKDLLQKVDIALYKAKNNGRNKVEFFN